MEIKRSKTKNYLPKDDYLALCRNIDKLLDEQLTEGKNPRLPLYVTMLDENGEPNEYHPED